MSSKTLWQTLEVKGAELAGKIDSLIAEGNVRRIRVRQRDRTIAEFPLTAGVVGAVLAPVVAAIGVLAAMLTECSIDVERSQPPASPIPPAPGPAAASED